MGKRVFLTAGTLLFSTSILSKDLGVQGPVFEIREHSLLEMIQAKLRSLSPEKLRDHQKEIQERVKKSIENPAPVAGIQKATSTQSRLFDPSIVIEEDIKDHKGYYLARKGTSLNPLDYHSFGKPLIVIQGEDAAQVAWALKQGGKIVLVSGKPLHLSRLYKKPFFFDQGGIITSKFAIRAVPARISQRDKLLVIEEVNLEEGQRK